MGLNNECFGKQMHDLNTRKLLVPNILDWSYCFNNYTYMRRYKHLMLSVNN